MQTSDAIAAIEARMAEPRYEFSDQAVLPKDAVRKILAELKLQQLYVRQLRDMRELLEARWRK